MCSSDLTIAADKKLASAPTDAKDTPKEIWRASFKAADLATGWRKDKGEITIEEGALKLWTKPRAPGQQPPRVNQIVQIGRASWRERG